MRATAENIDELLFSPAEEPERKERAVATPDNIDELLSDSKVPEYSADYGEAERLEDERTLKERLGNIKVQLGPWQAEDTTWADVFGEDAVAGLVGMGHMMSDSWRGLKQIAGLDKEEERMNEAIMRELYSSEEYGTEAVVGGVAGAIADPVGIGVGGITAKALRKGYQLAKGAKATKPSSLIAQNTAEGAVTGAVSGATGYVDESQDQTRFGQAIIGGTVGGALAYGLTKVGVFKGTPKELKEERLAYETIGELESQIGVRVNGGMTLDEALADIRQTFPDLINDAKKVSEDYNVLPDFAGAGRNYRRTQEVSRGTKPIETTRGAVGDTFSKLTGVLSTNIKQISPRMFGKLRRHDANVAMRPEKYESMRRPFAQLFPAAGARKVDNPAHVLDKSEIETLNGYLINGKFDDARDFLRSKRGPEAVQAFDDSLKVFKELGDEMKKYGIIDKMEENYWHRSINFDTRDEFLEVLGREDPGMLNRWEAKLAELNRISRERRGHELNELEENNALSRFIFGGGDDITTIGLAKSRGIKKVKPEWVKYYNNPLEAMDSYIHRAVAEIEKAKFFGKDVYTSGLRNAKDVDGLFNLDSTLDASMASNMFKGLSTDDAESLRHLLKVRFGHANGQVGRLQGRYRALVNITLLGNPISAITQFGDLGMSMYKNGVTRTAREMIKRASQQGRKDRLTIEDLGLERRYTEFEDLAHIKGGAEFDQKLLKVQEALFKWSGFNAVDRLGKETFVNTALDKAVKLVGDKKSMEYMRWSKKLRSEWGADAVKIEKDLIKYAADPKKENVTDDVKAFLFSELANVQPISRSEVPELYLTSPIGRTMYTLKTFLIKQLDVIRNDVVETFRSGSPVEAGRNLTKYMALLGGMNLAADEVKELVTGKKSFSDLEEETQAFVAADLLEQIGQVGAGLSGSTLKTFGFSGYTMKDISSEGASGYIQSLIPPLPIADELLKVGYQLAAAAKEGEAPEISMERQGKRVFQQVPMVGRPLANYFFKDKREFNLFDQPEESDLLAPGDEESDVTQGEGDVQVFAEGGEVIPENDNPVINNPPPLTEAIEQTTTQSPLPEVGPGDAVSLSQPVSQTESTEVAEELDKNRKGESVEQMQERLTEPEVGKEGMTHTEQSPVGELGRPVLNTIGDVINAAPKVWESLDLVDKVALSTAPIPVVGDLMGLVGDAKMYFEDPDSNTWSNYGLTALGLVPFIPNMSLGVKIVDKGKELEVENIISKGKSPFEGKEVEVWRGVEAGTIEAAQKGPREVGEHASTSPAMASRFAEEATLDDKTGGLYRRREKLKKGIVIPDAEYGYNNAENTAYTLMQHKDFQSKEDQQMLRRIIAGFQTQTRKVWDKIDAMPGPDEGKGKIASQMKEQIAETYGGFVRQFLSNKGYDHVAYINTHEKLPSGDYDASLILLQPKEWEEVGTTVDKSVGKLAKMDAGVYEDEVGNFFEVTKEGKILPVSFGE